MRTEDVRNFVVVAGSRSLVSAAEALGISQPTLSKSIARLERSLGEPVIERLARGIRLTEAGRVFFDHSRKADISFNDGVAAVRDLRQGRSGTVRFGIGIGVPKVLVAQACASALKDRSVCLEISAGMSDSLSSAVTAGDADFVISGVRPPEEGSLVWKALFDDPMIPVAPLGHALLGKHSMTWELFAQQTWIVPDRGTLTRSWFDRQFIKRGLMTPRQVISLRTYFPAFELGRDLGAVSVVPRSLVRKDLDVQNHREIKRPADWKLDRVVGVLYRRDGYLSTAAVRLIDAFEAVARELFGASESGQP